jgi:hypothetical protein
MNSLGTLVDNENAFFSSLFKQNDLEELGRGFSPFTRFSDIKPSITLFNDKDANINNIWLSPTTEDSETKLFTPFFSEIINEIQKIDTQKTENNNLLSFTPNVLISHVNINTNEIKTVEQINQEKVSYLETEITPLLISLLKNEDIEFGQNNESIRLVYNKIKENELATKEWFYRLFNHYFGSEKETNILIGLLYIVEFLHEGFNSMSQTIALASLSHRNNEIKEFGVRILEASCTIDNLNILKSIETGTKWLQDYINQVIEDFNQTLCQY